jgi:hypothetical protein
VAGGLQSDQEISCNQIVFKVAEPVDILGEGVLDVLNRDVHLASHDLSTSPCQAVQRHLGSPASFLALRERQRSEVPVKVMVGPKLAEPCLHCSQTRCPEMQLSHMLG